jgi:hypothetical protein
MSPIEGKNVLLQFYKDGDYYTYVCASDCSIEFTTEVDETTTITDGVWPVFEGDRLSFAVTLSGLIILDGTEPIAFWLLENFQLQLLPVQFRILMQDPITSLIKVIIGNAIIMRTALTGPASDFANGDFEFKGSGMPTISNSVIGCSATIGTLIAGYDPDTGNVTITYSDVVGADRLEYSVDGGDRIPVFSPGTNGIFFIAGLSDGPHTVQVWTVCENGIDGEDNTVVFEISGGEPGPTCALPGVPVMSDITGSSATATWDAATGPPAQGYFWEMRFVATGNLASSGYTSDTFANITGLIEGGDYYFQVKSLCEEGVSESSYQRTDFNASPACALPGTPSMSAVASTTATATWSAASPAPADGYAWQVLDGLTVIASGTTASTNVNITGLTANTDYTFQVKSLCDTGVSESAFVTIDFTTEAASCANPGPVFVNTFGLDPGDANASWSAASPAPADGYDWEVIRLSDSTVVDSGHTAGLTANLTGLTTGVDYRFQVRSVCVTGLSYSSFRTRDFTST